MHDIQSAIYRLELGGGARIIRLGLALLAFAGLAVYFDSHFYQNFRSEEAMDTAQLAKNISEGRGFSTRYIRPFSLYLVSRGGMENQARAAGPHPDLANAPLYPAFLAGLIKVLPFHFKIASTEGKNFSVYQPEVLIAAVNQILFLAGVVLVFRLGVKLFDEPTAWVAASAYACSEIYWKLSISGISTMLLIVVFLLFFWNLAVLEEEIRLERPGLSRILALAALLGGVAGAGTLTRYSFGWVMPPVVVFLLVYGGKRRWPVVGVTVAVFLVVLAPWAWRNYSLCGNPFGVAGYAPYEMTRAFPGDKLSRLLDPAGGFRMVGFWDLRTKVLGNLHEILQRKLPTLGANWLFTFFLAGLLIPFNKPALQRLRYFLLLLIPLFILVEALGMTHLSADFPEATSENLLVVFAPAAFIFGAGFFCVLMEHLNPAPPQRLLAVGAFCVVTGLPFLSGLLTERVGPLAYAYPPYFPPALQTICRWMRPDEAVMTDIPWAIAWYGECEGTPLSLDAKGGFEKARAKTGNINGVFLSGKFMNEGFRGMMGAEEGWGGVVTHALGARTAPPGFPFQSLLVELLPDEVFLCPSARWESSGASK